MKWGNASNAGAWFFFCVALMACQQRMADQPRYKPLAKSEFFGDDRSARPLVEGTVARGELKTDEHFYTGKVNGRLVDMFPFPITEKVLRRGEERFNIYCSPCHDRIGTGQGMIVKRGYQSPSSYHSERLRIAPVGYFFDVITRGFGRMPDYAQQVPPNDRWAIIAYIRALQLSQNAKLGDVPEGARPALEANP
ncbi:MAG TPA: cytochrome c [Candidatus Binatia bacterium]